MVLLIACLHAIPVFLTAVIFKSRGALFISALIFASLGVLTGNPTYILVDVIAVITAYVICRGFLSEDTGIPISSWLIFIVAGTLIYIYVENGGQFPDQKKDVHNTDVEKSLGKSKRPVINNVQDAEYQRQLELLYPNSARLNHCLNLRTQEETNRCVQNQ